MFKKITIIAFIAFLTSASIFVHDAYATDIQEIKKLVASDAEANENFGRSVSVSGDYVIVGADHENEGGNDAGAAYVFYKNKGGMGNWGQVKKLTASDAEARDYFGHSVSISGDYAIVGGESAGGGDAGAAYVFYKDQGGTDNWGQVKKLTASDAEYGDNFGYSVSISGDYAIIGARDEDAGGGDAGAAYVFYKDQGGTDNWGQVKKLTASDAEADDQFGESVSISGDYAIVGASEENTGGPYAGTAYIFFKDQGGTDNWGQVKKLTAKDVEGGDNFGRSVSIYADFAIVGAPGADEGGIGRGVAYIFNKDQGGADNWGEFKKLKDGHTMDDDNYGRSVSIYGDYVIIGAYSGGIGGPQVRLGKAYIYYKNQGGEGNWWPVKMLTASDEESNDSFGNSVSISGNHTIVGAPTEDAGGYDAGAAYIFKLITTGVEETPEMSNVVIYPEIADDIITIEYTIENSGISENRQAAIYSIDGRKLIEQPLDGEQTIINIANLTPGTYFIEVNTSGGPVVRKFIKR